MVGREEGLHVEGFPEAVKLVKLTGSKPRRLADLGLHKHDLDFALECLDGINLVPEEPYALRQGLWQSAIINWFKCFGDSKSRFSLNPKSIYRTEPLAIESFEYFKLLRNKHFVHDENSYTQCIPGAVLNRSDSEYKIAKILCSGFHGVTLEQSSFSNLRLLILGAREWVIEQFDKLCDDLTKELEQKPYERLMGMESVTYSKPAIDDIGKPRDTP